MCVVFGRVGWLNEMTGAVCLDAPFAKHAVRFAGRELTANS